MTSDVTLRFFFDDSGAITHLLFNQSGEAVRFKTTKPPPPAIQLEREVLARYEGTFAYDWFTGSAEQRSAADTWTGTVSVDADGTAWLDLDDQPRLEIIPFTETKFYLLGFDARLEFVVHPATRQATQMKLTGDGTVFDFYRR